MRKLASAVVALFVYAACTQAAEYVGQVVKVDGDKITIKVKDAEKTFTTNKDTKYTSKNKKQAEAVASEGLKHKIFTNTKKPATVTITANDEGLASEVAIGAAKKKKADK